MTILAVLENEQAIPSLNTMMAKLQPEADLLCFGSALPALAAARKTEIDIAIVDVKLPELNGLDFGQYLQELYPFVNLIYLSEDSEQAFDAMRQHASGYLLKPAEKESFRRELEDLRHPTVQKNEKRLFAQTFGNFELFVDGKPVVFKYNKTKELVAVLINNRGAQTSNGEVIACLWEDDGDPEKKASYLSNLRQDLQNTFTKLKLNGIILNYFMSNINSRTRVYIITDDYEKLQHFILDKLGRGVTLHDVIGGYTGKKRVQLEVVLSKDDFSDLIDFMSKEKIQSFMTSDVVSQVYGLWNKKSLLDLSEQ